MDAHRAGAIRLDGKTGLRPGGLPYVVRQPLAGLDPVAGVFAKHAIALSLLLLSLEVSHVFPDELVA
jgi:hypothetical protein